ncbi:MAG: hypothetical protein KatS3mg059_0428 [Thermomicrobiales bacterium]|nr:MAG: hypothetical protein KatS3mg059_0428 [Thermomicrobiales bacterium]
MLSFVQAVDTSLVRGAWPDAAADVRAIGTPKCPIGDAAHRAGLGHRPQRASIYAWRRPYFLITSCRRSSGIA